MPADNSSTTSSTRNRQGGAVKGRGEGGGGGKEKKRKEKERGGGKGKEKGKEKGNSHYIIGSAGCTSTCPP